MTFTSHLRSTNRSVDGINVLSYTAPFTVNLALVTVVEASSDDLVGNRGGIRTWNLTSLLPSPTPTSTSSTSPSRTATAAHTPGAVGCGRDLKRDDWNDLVVGTRLSNGS